MPCSLSDITRQACPQNSKPFGSARSNTSAASASIFSGSSNRVLWVLAISASILVSTSITASARMLPSGDSEELINPLLDFVRDVDHFDDCDRRHRSRSRWGICSSFAAFQCFHEKLKNFVDEKKEIPVAPPSSSTKCSHGGKEEGEFVKWIFGYTYCTVELDPIRTSSPQICRAMPVWS